MGKVKINSYKDLMDTKKVEAVAENNNCTLRNGKGSHGIIEYTDTNNKNYMMVYTKNGVSIGVARKIFKFFKSLGFFVLTFIIIQNILFYFK